MRIFQEMLYALKLASKAMHSDTSAKGKADLSVINHVIEKAESLERISENYSRNAR